MDSLALDFGPPQQQAPHSSFPSERVVDDAAPAFVPLADLAPTTDASDLTGIARAAALAPEVDFRNEVEYRELTCKSVLSPCNSPRVPFTYSINPYRGCEFGCTYCYARYTHEYMAFEDWLDFERKIFVKSNAREVLAAELRKQDFSRDWIAIGTATDPYQPAERRLEITRGLLEVLAQRRNLRLSITTKSDLVTRDLDLLQEIAAHSEIHVNLTITTPRYELARIVEPRAPRPDKRFAAVRQLSEAGIPVDVFVMPVLPHVNDAPADLETLVRLTAEAGAYYLATQVLFLRRCSRKRFFPFIEEHFPELLPVYRRLYGRSGAELAEYTARTYAQVQRMKAEYGLHGFRRDRPPDYEPDQLDLGL